MSRVFIMIVTVFMSATVWGAVQTASIGQTSASKQKVMRLSDLTAGYFAKDHKIVPTLGLTYMKLDSSGRSPSSERGVMFGALVQDKLGLGSNIQYGLQYYTANSTWRGDNNMDLKREYIGVPVFFTSDVTQGPQSTVYFKGGAILGYMLSAEAEFLGAKKSVATLFKREDIIGSIGVGYSVRQPKMSTLNVELAYNRGLIDVLRGEGPSRRAVTDGVVVGASVLF